MGKVIVLISTTPDGFAEAQNVTTDPEFFELSLRLMNDAQAIIFGRTTFEIFQERWPGRLEDKSTPEFVRKMAQSLNDIEKIVFSSTLKSTHWNNSKIEKKVDADFIKKFKRNGNGGLLVFGSLSLIESLTEMNLVDEYYFNIQPVIAGKGEARFFKKVNLNVAHPLVYVDYQHMSSGAHVIHYRNGGIG